MNDPQILQWLKAHALNMCRENTKNQEYVVVSWFDRENCLQYTYGTDIVDCVEQAVSGFARAGTKLSVKLPPGRAYK